MRVYTSLLLNYLRKKTSFNSEESLLLQIASLLTRDKQRQTHPKRNTYYNLKDDTSQRPNIYCPRISIVIHDLLIQFLFIYAFILMYNVVEYFWRHVLGCCHRELSDISEFERGTIVDEFDFF